MSKCKYRDPVIYEGKDWPEYYKWVELMEEYFRAYANLFPNDQERVQFAVNYTNGTPKQQIDTPRHFMKKMHCEDVYFMYEKQAPSLVGAIEEPDIPSKYQQFLRVFSEKEAGILSTIKGIHDINMHEGATSPYRPLYPISATELKALQKYLKAAQSKDWI
ncbi:hypothetical protein VTO42DRAFT_2760 [Malbranchea cinnamomea]